MTTRQVCPSSASNSHNCRSMGALHPGPAHVTAPHSFVHVQYGVSIFWGMEEQRCEEILYRVAVFSQISPLEEDEVEQDTFSVCYAPVQRSKIANDQITIPQTFSSDWSIKLAISHALAQSTKLCLYEARMGDLVNETKDMPDHLARTGKV